ncbi:hypothetical protein EC968_008365 [Mortierella alpina]|nr:hypothetical protein EC968_008365 [Mortierella alpina]
MDSLIKDYDKILKRQRVLETSDPLDRLIAVVNEAKDKIREDPSSVTSSLAALGKSANSTSERISNEYKELQSALSKYSKGIDKDYEEDDSNTFHSAGQLRDRRRIRKGMLKPEAGLEVPDSMRHQFVEMFDIVAALKENNLEPALQWATRHRSGLEKRSSILEFKLHRQKYLQLLEAGQVQDSIAYARKNFGYFGNRHIEDIKRLMCCIIFMDRIKTSRYADLMDPNTTSDIQHMFTRDFCSLIGLSCDSPLYVSVTVGTQAMPTMIKMASIMKAKKTEWSQQSELPVEINLTDETKFHSIFVCPVSKEQASEDNPPMMMACGHVICKESLLKLSRGLNSSKFKCPYCPAESTVQQATSKKMKKLEKEAKDKAAKAASKEKKGSKKKASKKQDSSDDSDSEGDQKHTPAKKKAPVDSDSDSDSSSSSEEDDPDTQPPPKSKKKKPKKKKSKKKAGAADDDEAEAPENEDGAVDGNEGEGNKDKKKKVKKEKKEGTGRKGEYGIWIGNLSFLTTEKALRHFFKDVGADITRVNMPTGSGYNKKGNKGFAYVDFATSEAQVEAIKMSEKELEGRKVLIKSSKSFEGRPAISKAAVQEKSMKQKHAVSPTLFVGNLSFQSTREGLQKLFEDCGEIRKVRLATFEDSGKCKGFAYIDYMSPESATAALTNPSKHFLDGRKLNIEYASEEATLKGNPREYRKRKREEEDAAAIARGEVPPSQKEEVAAAEAAEAAEEERRKFNAEQKAKRQRRQPGDAPAKKLQGHQRPGLALANAQRAPQGIVEFKGNKVTF